ncbi:MAG: pyridoxal phosphate-dependent aminotransferase, partial [Gemmatimonadales bacterium]
GLEVDETREITITCGATEAMAAALLAIINPGDEVLVFEPFYENYGPDAILCGAVPVWLPLASDAPLDFDRMRAAIGPHTRAIVLNSPNNPTGSALPDGAVERILSHTEALVICDEAYQDFGGPSAIPLLARWSRLVVLRTFSKALGLAGLRFGLALAHPAVAREITKGKLPYNVNLMTLAAARTALDHAPLLAGRTREIIETRDRFVARLRGVPGLTVYPTAANFVLIRSSSLPAKELCRRLLDDYGILIRDVSEGAQLAGCVRISIGTSEDMDAVIAALEQILANPRQTPSHG